MNKVLNLIGLALRSRNVSCGCDTVLMNIRSKKCFLVLIASDASVATIKKLVDKCMFYQIPYDLSFNTDQLSSCCGKGSIKVISINDNGFAKNIIKLIKESTSYEG